MLSLDGPLEFFHGETVSLEVLIDGLEEVFRHVGLSVEDPEVFVVGIGHHRVTVVLIQSHHPVVSRDIQGRHELHLQLGVGVLCVVGVWVGLADRLTLNSVAVADIVDSDRFISVEGVGGSGLFAVSFEVERNECLLVPCSHVLVEIDVGHSLRRIQGKVGGGFPLGVGQLPGSKPDQNGY